MDYSNEDYFQNEANFPIPKNGLELFCLPYKETAEKRIPISIWDLDLYNLKRAYNVPLELQENINNPKNDKSHCEEDEEEWIEELHPIEFCESQIFEDDEQEKVSLSQNNDHQYKCCYCYFEGNILQLKNHTRYCHAEECITGNWCTYCQLSFENESVFKQHQINEHDLHCLQCGKNCKTQKLLDAHRSVHIEQKCFKCSTCDKVFPAQRYLMRHLDRHQKNLKDLNPVKEKVFKCTLCLKGFTKKESLVKHMRIHSRDSLKCSLCDFTCGKKVTLKMHVISHEGNRKYKCSHCDFSFKQIGHLKRHIVRFNH